MAPELSGSGFISMHLIEILLPLRDNEGRAFSAEKFSRIRQTLAERFGGVTAFMRAPAHGIDHDGGQLRQDDIVIIEVMTSSLETDWWGAYRQQLEADFAQDEIVIRASAITKL